MYWLCKFITAAFIWTHDIKLEIRATAGTPCLFIMLAVKTGSKKMTKAYSKISGYDRPHVYVFVSDKKLFHSGERFQKFSDTARKYAGYVWTRAVFVKKNLRFHKFSDTCGHGLRNFHPLFINLFLVWCRPLTGTSVTNQKHGLKNGERISRILLLYFHYVEAAIFPYDARSRYTRTNIFHGKGSLEISLVCDLVY